MTSQVSERPTRLQVNKPRVKATPLGLSSGEIGAGLLAIMSFVFVVAYYFTSLAPEKERLASLEAELSRRTEVLVKNAIADVEDPADDPVQAALGSLDEFRTQFLKPVTAGRIALLSEVNALARQTSVRITSGIDMRLETQVQDPDKPLPPDKVAPFPKAAVRFTVFGPYPNLRSFISQVQRSKQFVIIESIDLKTIDESLTAGASTAPPGSGIALTVGLSAYFRP